MFSKENFVLNWQNIMAKFDHYFGIKMYFWIFVAAVVLAFIFRKRKNKTPKTIVVDLSIIAMLVVFNPIVFGILNKFVEDGDDYWRFFWIIPLAPAMAYAFTTLATFKNKIWIKIPVAVCVLFLLCNSGKLVYNEDNFQEVGNYYKCPDEILAMVKIISEDENEDEKKVMFPTEFAPWIRQIDGSLKMYYPRYIGEYYGYPLDYSNGIINVYMSYLEKMGCNYYIVRNINLDYDFEVNGYHPIEKNDNYIIYKK